MVWRITYVVLLTTGPSYEIPVDIGDILKRHREREREREREGENASTFNWIVSRNKKLPPRETQNYIFFLSLFLLCRRRIFAIIIEACCETFPIVFCLSPWEWKRDIVCVCMWVCGSDRERERDIVDLAFYLLLRSHLWPSRSDFLSDRL